MNNGLTFEEGITAGIVKSRRPSGRGFSFDMCIEFDTKSIHLDTATGSIPPNACTINILKTWPNNPSFGSTSHSPYWSKSCL